MCSFPIRHQNHRNIYLHSLSQGANEHGTYSQIYRYAKSTIPIYNMYNLHVFHQTGQLFSTQNLFTHKDQQTSSYTILAVSHAVCEFWINTFIACAMDVGHSYFSW